MFKKFKNKPRIFEYCSEHKPLARKESNQDLLELSSIQMMWMYYSNSSAVNYDIEYWLEHQTWDSDEDFMDHLYTKFGPICCYVTDAQRRTAYIESQMFINWGPPYTYMGDIYHPYYPGGFLFGSTDGPEFN